MTDWSRRTFWTATLMTCGYFALMCVLWPFAKLDQIINRRKP